MKKKVSLWLILVALLAQGALADSAFPVYEVRSPGSQATVYLFPSIHAANDMAYPLSQAARSAFEASDYLAVECDILAAETDLTASLGMAQKLMLKNGQTILDYLPQELFDRVKEYLSQRGLYMAMYEKYHPFMLMSALEMAAAQDAQLDATQGLDMYFLREARNAGKPVIEIESIQEQLSLMVDQMPAGVWPMLVEEYLPPNDQNGMVVTRLLYDALVLGDATAVNGLLAMEEELLGVEDSALYEEYNRLLLTQRDARMKDAVLGFFAANQNVFVVVGAAHVLGPTGLVNSLKAAGCAVRRVG